MDIEGLRSAGIEVARLFTRAEAGKLRTQIDADARWSPSRVQRSRTAPSGTVLRPQDRSAEGNGLRGLPDIVDVFNQRALARLLPNVLRTFGANIDELSEFNAVRYPPGGQYRVHIDNGPGLSHRRFTVVCYLNDDMTGGETDFPDLGVWAKPATGMAIAFPSEYRHASLPVETGMKHVLVCWMLGPEPFKGW